MRRRREGCFETGASSKAGDGSGGCCWEEAAEGAVDRAEDEVAKAENRAGVESGRKIDEVEAGAGADAASEDVEEG